MEDVAALRSIAGLSEGMGQVSVFGLFLMSFETPVRGLVQRLLESVFYSWMLLVSVTLLVN